MCQKAGTEFIIVKQILEREPERLIDAMLRVMQRKLDLFVEWRSHPGNPHPPKLIRYFGEVDTIEKATEAMMKKLTQEFAQFTSANNTLYVCNELRKRFRYEPRTPE